MLPTIDLHNAPSIVFFFGKAGAGKSHVAKLVAKLTGWHVYEADDDVTDAMTTALRNQRPFTAQMRDEFFEIITQKILLLQHKHKNLVVAQGVYKQQHRDGLAKRIADMELICVTASDAVIAQRLGRRAGGITRESAAALIADFEAPPGNCKTISNEKDDMQIIAELVRLYGE